MIACMVHLAIFAMAAVMLKSGHDGSMGGGLGNFYDGSSSVDISTGDSMGGRLGNYCDESSSVKIQHLC